MVMTKPVLTLSVDVRCMRCDHVTDPADCDTIAVCGHDEMCYTREYVDHHDKVAYHLGCESSKICTLYKNAEQIFLGRRDIMEDGPHRCFQCCNVNECNTALCTDGPGGGAVTSESVATHNHPATTAAVAATTHGHHGNGCPPGFVEWTGHRSCYFFDTSDMIWDDARALCQGHGADLVSINTEGEDTFIVEQLTSLAPSDITRGMWIGGKYDTNDNKFKWVDGSDVTFERYKTGSPRHQGNYRLLLINPAVNAAFSGWPWSSDIGAFYKRGAICELNY